MKYFFIPIFILILYGCNNNQNLQLNNQSKQNLDSFYETPLHDAIRAKNLNEVKLLTNENNINIKNNLGHTPLHLAVMMNEYKIVKFLIKNGANIDTIDTFGDSALIDSVRNRKDNISKLLICNNANTNIKDKYQLEALNYAKKETLIYNALKTKELNILCKATNKKVVVTLLEHHKKINSVFVTNGFDEIILDKPYQSTTFNTNKKSKLHIENKNKEELEDKYSNLINKKIVKKVKVTLLEHYKDKSSIIISNKKGNLVLDKAYETANLTKNLAPTKALETASKKEIFENYGSLIKEKMNLNFKYNSDEVTQETKENLKEIINYIKNCDNCTITIKGHTDTVGNDSFNLELSKKRANKIKEILVDNKIESSKIKTEYYGETKPFIKTADEIKQPLNRRVNITVQRGNN